MDEENFEQTDYEDEEDDLEKMCLDSNLSMKIDNTHESQGNKNEKISDFPTTKLINEIHEAKQKEVNRHKMYIKMYKAIKDQDTDLLHFLLKQGEPTDFQKKLNASLRIAMFNNSKETVRFLLEKGANPNSKKKNKSALQAAVLHSNVEIVDMLLKHGADANEICQSCTKAVKIPYLRMKNADKCYEVIEKYPIKVPLLHHAITKRNLDVIKLLLEYNANPNVKDRHDTSPLEKAMDQKNMQLFELLLQYNANPNVETMHCIPLLHKAIEEDDEKSVKHLVEHGADVNAQLWDQNSLLHTAVLKSSIAIVELLLERGANVDATNMRARRPLDYAVDRGELNLVQLLLEYDATIYHTNNVTTCAWKMSIQNKMDDITKFFMIHMIKMKSIGWKHNEEMEAHARSILGSEFNTRFAICNSEVARMHGVGLYKNITLYTLMRKPVNKMNNYFKIKFNVAINENDYPNYASLILRRLNTIKAHTQTRDTNEQEK